MILLFFIVSPLILGSYSKGIPNFVYSSSPPRDSSQIWVRLPDFTVFAYDTTTGRNCWMSTHVWDPYGSLNTTTEGWLKHTQAVAMDNDSSVVYFPGDYYIEKVSYNTDDVAADPTCFTLQWGQYQDVSTGGVGVDSLDLDGKANSGTFSIGREIGEDDVVEMKAYENGAGDINNPTVWIHAREAVGWGNEFGVGGAFDNTTPTS
jgi:hypothetical protein